MNLGHNNDDDGGGKWRGESRESMAVVCCFFAEVNMGHTKWDKEGEENDGFCLFYLEIGWW